MKPICLVTCSTRMDLAPVLQLYMKLDALGRCLAHHFTQYVSVQRRRILQIYIGPGYVFTVLQIRGETRIRVNACTFIRGAVISCRFLGCYMHRPYRFI